MKNTIDEKKYLIVLLLFLFLALFSNCFNYSNGIIKEEKIDNKYYGLSYVRDIFNISVLDKIKRQKNLIVGIETNRPPFIYKKGNVIKGFEIDLLKYIANELQVNIEFIEIEQTYQINSLLNNKVHILATGMTHTIERDLYIDFSITYFMNGQGFLIKKFDEENSLDNLAGKKIGVVRDSLAKKMLNKLKPKIDIYALLNSDKLLNALQNDKIVGISADINELLFLRGQMKDSNNYIILPELINKKPYAFGLPENDSDFRDFINHVLIKCCMKGEYQRLFNKYFAKNTKYEYSPLWKMELWY